MNRVDCRRKQQWPILKYRIATNTNEFWDYSEHRGSMFLLPAGNYLPVYTTLHPRRQ
jgi:hypothetical protein